MSYPRVEVNNEGCQFVCYACRNSETPDYVIYLSESSTDRLFNKELFLSFTKNEKSVVLVPLPSKPAFALCCRRTDPLTGAPHYPRGDAALPHAELWFIPAAQYRHIQRTVIDWYLNGTLRCDAGLSQRCTRDGFSMKWSYPIDPQTGQRRLLCHCCRAYSWEAINSRGNPTTRMKPIVEADILEDVDDDVTAVIAEETTMVAQILVSLHTTAIPVQ